MKNFIISLGIVLLISAPVFLFAQEMDDEPVIFNAHLLETFDLAVVDGGTQEITFQTPAEYNGGVWEAAGIAPGFTTITVDATGDWEISIECPNFTAIAPATGVIPANNLSVWCEATGNYQFGAEVNCVYVSAVTSLGLTNGATNLITNGSGNTGGNLDNEFILHWRMGTRDNASMNTLSMFEQIAAGTFSLGDHTTTAMLNLIKL